MTDKHDAQALKFPRARMYGAKAMDLHFWGNLCEESKGKGVDSFVCEKVVLATDYEALEKEVRVLRISDGFLKTANLYVADLNTKLQKQLQAAREWMRHKRGCYGAVHSTCTCGLTAFLAAMGNS